MESVTLIFNFSLFLSRLFFVLFVSYSIVHVELIDYCVLRGLKEDKKIWIIFSVINSESCFCLLYHVRVKVLILYVMCFSFIISYWTKLWSCPKSFQILLNVNVNDFQLQQLHALQILYITSVYSLTIGTTSNTHSLSMKWNVPTRLPLCPGEMMVCSSVQQDPRAPGDRWHRTPIFQPLEGAPTSCPVQLSTTVASSLSTFSLLLPHCRPAPFMHLGQ